MFIFVDIHDFMIFSYLRSCFPFPSHLILNYVWIE
jgi:hypothetical protein